MGLIAIGDIHGCALTLDALLREVDPQPDDHLVFVGDYTDRGPRSRQVIERMLEMEGASQRRTGPRATFLRGNHDQMILDWVDHGEFDMWSENGGLTTLASYSGEDTIPADHIDFLRRTRLYLDTPGYCFVHAGLNPELSVARNLEVETARTFLWTRGHLGATQRRWEKTVVCGHTPMPLPLMEDDLICIDTGAVFPHHPEMGRLTAIRLPHREVVSVPYSD